MCGCPRRQIVVEERGFVFVDGVRVARYDEQRGVLQFLDRNRMRSERRGTCYVEVPVQTLKTALETKPNE